MKITDETRALIDDARDLARVSREITHGAASHADMIDDLADALEAALTEDDTCRKEDRLAARIGNGIVAVQAGEPEHVILGMLRGELRYEHNTPMPAEDDTEWEYGWDCAYTASGEHFDARSNGTTREEAWEPVEDEP